MEYYSAIKKKKNTFESVLMRWMKLEPIIQSEVSQKEKHQYSLLMHIYVCVCVYIYAYISWSVYSWLQYSRLEMYGTGNEGALSLQAV